MLSETDIHYITGFLYAARLQRRLMRNPLAA
jgi:hypothetical protein